MSTADGRRGGAAGAGRGRDGAAGAARGRDGGGGGRAGASRGGQARPARGAGQPGRPARPARAKAPARAPEPLPDMHDPEGVRLQKVLATAGLGSRRACEDLIAAGRVTVDGVPVTELGVRVDPQKVAIHVDGMRVQLDTSMVTIALNKPLGVVSTMHDPDGRPSLAEFVKNREERLFHVGRLDAETEGLILLTNDGELANRLAHPSHEVPKTYFAEVEGRVHPSLGKQLLKGIELEDGLVTVDSFRIVDQTAQASLVELVLHEGRNRVVRRIFDEVGFPVTRLVRTQIGPIKLGDLRPGRTRVLGKTELGTLMALVGM
ncbi:pseudouridine synthase [Cellulomonas chengniuliangii]|uniref:Pseudouridine synthase n=1 Tax=Cellulomonas chengniuliangii TaxID=2968084 RepID=A0ABY5L1J7_9CELL|nr:pseudouridine synthase [Cellulomonas chengniuliangii]MCC2308280.1 rRNA pseudouridine synthase [Cellulomonas chengniuliangii]MCC2317288.1 rRNA pseudouridine synthase [Cellulomonas chengniuliangii]UUI76666.1 rRNA pseudouridine synthase [Cellulomonas chengniuliangii]